MRKFFIRFLGFGLLALVGLSTWWIGEVVSPNSLLPNTQLGQTNVSGAALEDLELTVSTLTEKLSQAALTVRVAGKTYSFGYDELGVEIDPEATANSIRQVQSEGSFFVRLKRVLHALIYPRNFSLAVSVDEKKMQDVLSEKIPELANAEEAAAAFYETESSGTAKTADFKKVARDIRVSVSEMRAAAIEVNLLPEVEAVEEKKEEALNEDQELQLDKDEADLRAKTLILRAELPEEKIEIKLPLADYRYLVERTLSLEGWKVGLDYDQVRSYLINEVEKKLERAPEDAYIMELPTEGKRAKVEGFVRDGAQLKTDQAAAQIVSAVSQGTTEIELPIEIFNGLVLNKTDVDLGELSLISLGRSNFAGSPEGRDFNIRKAVKDHYANILLEPGSTFSYVEFLDGPVTTSRGWKDALAIFGGGASLTKVPGGGLCQVSTTIYRAAVHAGLNVTERKNHSLYVHYYVPHGEGLEATIYPGQQDLKFVNDTQNYVFIQSYISGDDIFVKFFGTPDGRSVELSGPYRSNEVPEGYTHPQFKTPFGSRDLVWIQKVTYADGEAKENVIVSRYKNPVPKKKSP